MINNDFDVSPDTQAILLLCGTLGAPMGESHVLTLPQYNAFAQSLNALGKRPGDLLHDAGLVEEVCAMPQENSRLKEPASAERVKALLDRGFALSMALNRWAQYGVRPVGRGDVLYPARMKQYLKGRAPSVLYYAGSNQLWSGGGMAFVGSRNISDEATEAIRRVVRACVDAGMPVVSGGARGADQTSMRTAFECGGSVVAALPGDLLKTCLARENREAIGAGRVLLFSAVDPDERFTPINAMDRNKYIYAMADYAFVAQSDTKGGTWTGAVEELKRPGHHPVFVYMGHSRVEGCAKLIAQGGLAWTPSDSLQPMIDKGMAATNKPVETSQQSLFDFAATDTNGDHGKEMVLRQVSEQETPYCVGAKPDVYSAVLPLLLSATAKKGQAEKGLRKTVDPDSYFSTKGWKLLLERACAEGKLMRTEKPKKRGKSDILYVGLQAEG